MAPESGVSSRGFVVPVALSVSDVQAIAPDPAAAVAARKIAKPRAWKTLGQSERALWGEYQGSASYQTRVSRPELAFKCSCPSRKIPCKHALALLFLAAEAESAISATDIGAEPDWVSDWLAKRDSTRRRAESPPRDSPQHVEARAKRASKRHGNVLAGVEQLEVWMADLVRHGLGRLPSEGAEVWDAQSRRLVDAQAPGLAGRVRRIGARVGVGENWTERVLEDLGRLSLLTHAYRRLDALPTPLQYDVRRAVGFTLDRDDVLAQGEHVEDEWVVACVTVLDDERLRMRRTWLVGRATARSALMLDVAAGSTPFQHTFVPASSFRGTLAFWPSARPERALLVDRSSAPVQGQAPPHARSIQAALDDYADGLAKDPWIERTLFILADVAVSRSSAPGWYAVEADGTALRLRGTGHEVLYALSGGLPLCLAGEWNGFVLDPLTAYVGGRAIALRTEFS